jgi:hypothetical protein
MRWTDVGASRMSRRAGSPMAGGISHAPAALASDRGSARVRVGAASAGAAKAIPEALLTD